MFVWKIREELQNNIRLAVWLSKIIEMEDSQAKKGCKRPCTVLTSTVSWLINTYMGETFITQIQPIFAIYKRPPSLLGRLESLILYLR